VEDPNQDCWENYPIIYQCQSEEMVTKAKQ